MNLAAVAIALLATLTDTSNGRKVYTPANGATTVYAFTFPISQKADVQATVTLAGITQPAPFSVSMNADQIASPGGNVTFTSAPANGATITLQRLQSLNQLTIFNPYFPFPAKTTEKSLDAIMMKVQQVERDVSDLSAKETTDISSTIAGGTGAVNLMAPVGTGTTTAQTLADRFGRLPTLFDYGCVGNGTTDDTTCLNAAGASGKRVLVPPGTYKATTTVQLAAGTVFYAADPNVSILTFSGAPNFVVDAVAMVGVGAGLDGIGINVTAGDYRRVVDHRFDFNFTRRCKINYTSTSTPNGFFAYVIWVAQGHSLYNIVIELNDITGNGVNLSDGMQISDAPGIRILNNRIHDFTSTQPGDLRFSWGIYVSARCPGALIQGNVLQNMNISGIHKNGDVANDSPGVRVIGNYIDSVVSACMAMNLANGVVVQGNWLSGCDMLLDLGDSPYAKAIGNHLENVITRAAGPISLNKPMLQLEGNDTNVVIEGNTFGVMGGALRGIDATTSEADVVYNGNQFLSGSPVLSIDSVGPRAIVTNNNFTPDSSSTFYLRIVGDNSIIKGNVINNTANMFGINSGGNRSIVEGNMVVGGKTCVFVSAGTDTIVRNNVCSGQTNTPVISDSGTSTLKRGNSFTNGANVGVSTLVAGTVTVSTTEIVTGDVVTLTRVAVGASPGHLSLGTIVNGTSFVINSTSGADTGTVAWEILH